jgi:hypothetical protein
VYNDFRIQAISDFWRIIFFGLDKWSQAAHLGSSQSLFKGLYSGLAGNLVGVLPLVTTLHVSPSLRVHFCSAFLLCVS